MRESTIERADKEATAALGGLSLKFVSPGRAHVPDRIKLFPLVPPEHREIVGKYFRFRGVQSAEQEAPPREKQVREHERLRAMGFSVDVIDQPPESKK
jgi:hypothetical protein